MKKILSIFLAVILCAALFACKPGSDTVSTEEPETDEQEYVFTDISGIPSPLSVNGEPVSYETFRYYYAMVKYKYDNGEDQYWETHDYSRDILDETIIYLRRDLAIEQYAKSVGVSLTDYEMSQIADSIDSMSFYYGGEYYFNEMLDDNYLTPELYE